MRFGGTSNKEEKAYKKEYEREQRSQPTQGKSKEYTFIF